MWPFDDYCNNNSLLIGKTVLITGANAGIGKEMAKNFYQRGAHVLMCCRNLNRAEEAASEIRAHCEPNEHNGSLTIYLLDLNNLTKVKKCAHEILEKEPKIHILINNAGVFTSPHRNTDDGFETHFGVNHLGPFLLTLILLPKIIDTGGARIINISSTGHKWCDSIDFTDLNFERREGAFWQAKAYGQSKLANILFARELARRLKEINADVTTYSLHPGNIGTDASKNFEYMFPKLLYPVMYVFRFVAKNFFKTPFQGIQTTLHCALDEQAGKESGLYYYGCKPAQPSSYAQNDETALKLWEVSLELTGLGKDFDPFVHKTAL